MTATKWDITEIPNQKGRVAIVTGSSSGIGYEAARVLADKNAEVIIAVRNVDKGNAAAEKIIELKKDANLSVMKLDLANLASVKSFADEFSRRYSQLDLLINNAGVMIPPYSKTDDGFELQFGTNHLGHFALTGYLLGLLAKTSGARIVNVSSSAHKAGNLDFDDLNWEKRRYRAWRAYGDSKIANIYFTNELNRRLKERGVGIITNAVHPGWTATELQRHTDYLGIAGILNSLFAQDISMGALPTLRAAFDKTAKGGEFYGPDGVFELRGYPVEVPTSELSKDESIAAKLWEVSQDLTGVKFKFQNRSEAAAG